MEIVLFRHGEPAVEGGRWLTPRAMGRWVRDYQASGLVGRAAPERSARVASGLRRMVASDALRAIESARALTGETPPADPLFREAALPLPRWRLPPAPPTLWAALSRIAWLAGWSGGEESLGMARRRAVDAVERLEHWARESGSLGVVGHGVFNQLIAGELRARGWSGPRRAATRHWGFSVYRKG